MAARKVRGLLDAGAQQVVVVAPAFCGADVLAAEPLVGSPAMSPAAGIALMMNNYLHDVATALLAASAVALWVMLRRYEAGQRGADAARYFLEIQGAMVKLARFSLAWIVLGGIPRLERLLLPLVRFRGQLRDLGGIRLDARVLPVEQVLVEHRLEGVRVELESPVELLLYFLLGWLAAIVGVLYVLALDRTEKFFERWKIPGVDGHILPEPRGPSIARRAVDPDDSRRPRELPRAPPLPAPG